jgi:hypothetical protein
MAVCSAARLARSGPCTASARPPLGAPVSGVDALTAPGARPAAGAAIEVEDTTAERADRAADPTAGDIAEAAVILETAATTAAGTDWASGTSAAAAKDALVPESPPLLSTAEDIAATMLVRTAVVSEAAPFPVDASKLLAAPTMLMMSSRDDSLDEFKYVTMKLDTFVDGAPSRLVKSTGGARVEDGLMDGVADEDTVDDGLSDSLRVGDAVLDVVPEGESEDVGELVLVGVIERETVDVDVTLSDPLGALVIEGDAPDEMVAVGELVAEELRLNVDEDE